LFGIMCNTVRMTNKYLRSDGKCEFRYKPNEPGHNKPEVRNTELQFSTIALRSSKGVTGSSWRHLRMRIMAVLADWIEGGNERLSMRQIGK
jgi:hypothetical protein